MCIEEARLECITAVSAQQILEVYREKKGTVVMDPTVVRALPGEELFVFQPIIGGFRTPIVVDHSKKERWSPLRAFRPQGL